MTTEEPILPIIKCPFIHKCDYYSKESVSCNDVLRGLDCGKRREFSE